MIVSTPDKELAKKEAIEWAQSVIDNPNVLYLDLETSGLPTDEDPRVDIVELAMIDHNGIPWADIKFKSAGGMSKEASQVTGFYDEDLKDCPYFKDFLPILSRLLRDKLIICYNAGFDVEQIKLNFEHYGVQCPKFDYGCAMLAYAKYLGHWSLRKKDWKWHKLPLLVTGDAHQAMTDVKSTQHLVSFIAGVVTFCEDEDDLIKLSF